MDIFPEAGAIPYRLNGKTIEVLLISTSSGKNMTIPKGLIDPGFTAVETVLNESYEEAGVQGRVLKPRLGKYGFKKWGGRCAVEVFAMKVTKLLKKWPENITRRRVWADYREASRQVKYPELGGLILKLPKRLKSLKASVSQR